MTHNNTALLVIDMQKAYFNNGALAERQKSLVTACNEIIDAATKSGLPVIYVRTAHQRDKSTWTLNMLDDGEGYLYYDDSDTQYIEGLHIANTNEVIKT